MKAGILQGNQNVRFSGKKFLLIAGLLIVITSIYLLSQQPNQTQKTATEARSLIAGTTIDLNVDHYMKNPNAKPPAMVWRYTLPSGQTMFGGPRKEGGCWFSPADKDGNPLGLGFSNICSKFHDILDAIRNRSHFVDITETNTGSSVMDEFLNIFRGGSGGLNASP